MKRDMISENPKTFLATCNRLFRYNHKTGELKSLEFKDENRSNIAMNSLTLRQEKSK